MRLTGRTSAFNSTHKRETTRSGRTRAYWVPGGPGGKAFRSANPPLSGAIRMMPRWVLLTDSVSTLAEGFSARTAGTFALDDLRTRCVGCLAIDRFVRNFRA